jgi:hypothetical protein
MHTIILHYYIVYISCEICSSSSISILYLRPAVRRLPHPVASRVWRDVHHEAVCGRPRARARPLCVGVVDRAGGHAAPAPLPERPAGTAHLRVCVSLTVCVCVCFLSLNHDPFPHASLIVYPCASLHSPNHVFSYVCLLISLLFPHSLHLFAAPLPPLRRPCATVTRRPDRPAPASLPSQSAPPRRRMRSARPNTRCRYGALSYDHC